MILFCTKCITPNSRPRIVFNAQNICNACTNSENKKKIDWSNRKEEFIKLVSDIKNRDAYFNKDYDCIVPWSGGKDSTSIALKLKMCQLIIFYHIGRRFWRFAYSYTTLTQTDTLV